MKKIISLFPELHFNLWADPWHIDEQIPEEIKMAQLNDWVLVCPNLVSVFYLDGEFWVT